MRRITGILLTTSIITLATIGVGFTPSKNLEVQKIELPSFKVVEFLKSVQAVEQKSVQKPIEKKYLDIPLSKELQDFTRNQAKYMGVPYELVIAIMDVESDFRVDVISGTNDYGIMQVNASNFNKMESIYGTMNFLNPKDNIVAGIYILSEAYETNDKDLHLALMAYNHGQAKAEAYWNKGVYTSEYSRKVKGAYETYRRTSTSSS